MTNFERKLPTENADEADIVRGILKVQAAFAAAQNRPLGRGTHTKGICARAVFEVYDVAKRVGDPALAARLVRGIYAKPGIYAATVRFANAASTIYKDRKPDLRAMSFSVELPPGMAAGTNYQDYSLQSATTFPINDAHTFAVLMKVLSAGSGANQLKAILSLSFRDFLRFAKAAAVGGWQLHGKLRAYQKIRYWSTVPFRNGPYEAVKYSAIPSEDNPAHELQKEPDALRDELARHLNEDAQMSSFDIALQLLDAANMKRWGMRRDASFWVENATVEWKEKQSPFYTVARLTLVAKSNLPIEECEPRYIDVTEHATADSQPLGSINRARRAAELASRQARLGQATSESIVEALPVAAAAPTSRLRTYAKRAAVAAAVAVALYYVAGWAYYGLAGRNIPALERADETVYLNQGWGKERASADRELYYYTAQGAGMHGVRYSWFVNLERPFSTDRLTDPDHMRSLNFIVDPVATQANPDQLPIGFARRYDDTAHDYVVDITCSACHTGQLNFTQNGKTTAVRIDGGASLNAFTDANAGSFQMEVGLSIFDTFVNPFKFVRFARRVLGPDANTIGGKWALWRHMGGVLRNLGSAATGSYAKSHYPVQEGFGRTDALARIGNVVFGDHIAAKNYKTGNAPVSYPYLWNIWKFDWVQYGASVSQPLARNVSEAMGTGAEFRLLDDYGRPVPRSERYDTSVAIDNQIRIEATLQKLKPPEWPDAFPPVDKQAAGRGEKLFTSICMPCHGPHPSSQAFKAASSPGRLAKDPLWVIRPVDVSYVGTDRTAADNFYKNTVDLTPAGVTFDEVKPLLRGEYEEMKTRQDAMIAALPKEIEQAKSAHDDAAAAEYEEEQKDAMANRLTEEGITETLDGIDFRAVSIGSGLNMLGMIIKEKYFADRHISGEQEACMEGFGTLDLPQVVDSYKPRPLQGVWATPPFLHNGSVPNLYEMLSPLEERSKKFFMGRREFDPVKVGYATKPVDGSSSGFWFDTSIPGNRNTGHEFGNGGGPGVIGRALTPGERMDIIEYLKVRQDEPAPVDRKPVDCFAGK